MKHKKLRRRKPTPPTTPPTTVIQNCTFTNHPASGRFAEALAEAAQANAEAIRALAQGLSSQSPMLVLGSDHEKAKDK